MQICTSNYTLFEMILLAKPSLSLPSPAPTKHFLSERCKFAFANLPIFLPVAFENPPIKQRLLPCGIFQILKLQVSSPQSFTKESLEEQQGLFSYGKGNIL